VKTAARIVDGRRSWRRPETQPRKVAPSLIFSRDIAAYHYNTLHKAAAASMAFFFTSDKKNANQRSAMVFGNRL
jgi:hypothetical protein